MRRWLVLLVLLALAVRSAAAVRPDVGLDLPEPKAGLTAKLPKLLRALDRGAAVYFPIETENAFAEGAWAEDALMSVLGAAGPLGLSEGGSSGDSRPPRGAHWLRAQGLPRVLLVENSSTVSPWSKGLRAWGLRAEIKSYADLEAAPGAFLDPARYDAVVFGSPGWWGDFANPPAGPSRMGDAVVAALRRFAHDGGTAIFVDIAQWDLLKAWPNSFRLAPLGPFKMSKLRALGRSREGALNLAPVGVAAEKLRLSKRVVLVQSPAFAYPDGVERPLFAAFAAADPGQGSGLVAAFAFHPLDQDDSLAGRSQRLLLNLLLTSGARRLSVDGQPAPVPSATPTPVPSATFSPSPSPDGSVQASPPPTMAPLPTATQQPTQRPTAIPSVPTRRELFLAAEFTPMQTELPPSPTRQPTLRPSPIPPTVTSLPTAPLSPTLKPTDTLVPTQRPTPVPTRFPSAPLTLPVAPAATLKPTAVRGLALVTPSGRSVSNSLGCLRSSPEPFAEGGTYVFFCLKSPGSLHLTVYDSLGRQLWQSEWKGYAAGQHQWAFDGYDQKGKLLKAGRYLYQLEARYPSGDRESKHGQFNKAAGKR